MLGWLLLGLFLGAVIVTIVFAVKYFDLKTAKDELKNKHVNKAIVSDIFKDKDVTHIKLEGLDEEGNMVVFDNVVENYNKSEIKKGIVIKD